MPAAARLILASAVVAALLLSACGGGSDQTSAEQAAIGSGATPAGKRTRPPSKGKRKPRAAPAGGLCQSQLGGFLGSMDSLRRRLAVGVTYDQYLNEIHGIRSTYREVPAEELRIDCVDAVAVPAEKAFNRYIQAANAWGECVSELGCGSAEIEPVLQQRWRAGSHFLSEAQRGLPRTS